MAFPRISTRHTGSKARKVCVVNTLWFLTSTHEFTLYIKRTITSAEKVMYSRLPVCWLVGWLVGLSPGLQKITEQTSMKLGWILVQNSPH